MNREVAVMIAGELPFAAGIIASVVISASLSAS